DHAPLSDIEVFHLGCILRGWHVLPRTAPNTAAINATVWLAAALSTNGRYRAPDTPGHPADLGDGGPLVDPVILMAVVQRHFLAEPHAAWDDASLAEARGLDVDDVARTQAVLDRVLGLVARAQAPVGARWWAGAADRRLRSA